MVHQHVLVCVWAFPKAVMSVHSFLPALGTRDTQTQSKEKGNAAKRTKAKGFQQLLLTRAIV